MPKFFATIVYVIDADTEDGATDVASLISAECVDEGEVEAAWVDRVEEADEDSLEEFEDL